MTYGSRVRLAAIARRGRALEGEYGQALVLFALGLVGCIALVGMSVDVGHYFYTKAALQRAADAAALAGSQDLPTTDVARTTAKSYVTDNGGADSTNVSFSTSQSTNDTIAVSVSKYVKYDFLALVGISGGTATANATARYSSKAITGYSWTAVSPFVIWGGNRKTEVHTGDDACPLHTCVGRSYTFEDTGWLSASGSPDKVSNNPDWTANGSNNFKGDINHGSGNPVSQIGETFSDGGLGSVTVPSTGSIIVIPIVSKASGNSNLRTFTIAAWAIVKVDSGCTKQHCTGTIQSSSTTAPDGWDTSGSVQPPSGLSYNGITQGLVG